VIVLLSNKLISCDTIVPFVAELVRQYPGMRPEFICFEPKTLRAIKANAVLYDLMSSLGPVRQYGREMRWGLLQFIRHRLVSILRVGRLAILAASGNVGILHFKALNFWPLRAIALIAGRRACYVQSSAAGVSNTERSVSEAIAVREHSAVTPAAGTLVGFTENWEAFGDKRLSGVPRYLLPPTYAYPAWIRHLQSRGDGYFAAAFAAAGVPPSDTIVSYVLSSMDTNGLLRDPNSFPALFEETLDLLDRCGCCDPVFIKPHPATPARTLEFIRAAVARRAGRKLIICDIHPMVLASRSRFAIANCYSTTFAPFRQAGVETVEYSEYRDEILGLTGRGSMRPELVSHFVNRDPDRLGEVLRSLLSRRPGAVVGAAVPEFPSDLLAALGVRREGTPQLCTEGART
jgi:hypothetical protein